MSLHDDIIKGFWSYSKAMYSSWYYYMPANILLDAGEGIGTMLGNFVFGIEKIFLSHGHYDHVGGLPGLLLARNMAMGEKSKPVDIYYPENDYFMKVIMDYTKKLGENFQFEISWKSVKPGDTLSLKKGGRKWEIQAFSTKHLRNGLTLGYKLIETRSRLKSEYSGFESVKIAEIVKEKGKTAIMEEYKKNLWAYSGDSIAVDWKDINEVEVLLHDGTFLDSDDRKVMSHATIEEAVTVAKLAGAGCLILVHISSRYKRKDVLQKLPGIIKKVDYKKPVYIQNKGKLITLSGEIYGVWK